MAISTPISPASVAGTTPTPMLLGWSGAHDAIYPVALWEPVTLPTLTAVSGTVSTSSTSPVGFTIITRDAAGTATSRFTGTFPAGVTHADTAALAIPVLTLTPGDDIVCVPDGTMPADGGGLVLAFVAA